MSVLREPARYWSSCSEWPAHKKNPRSLRGTGNRCKVVSVASTSHGGAFRGVQSKSWGSLPYALRYAMSRQRIRWAYMMTICLIHTGLDQGMGSDWCPFDLIASPLFAPSFFLFRTIAGSTDGITTIERIFVSRCRLATLSSFIGSFLEDWIYVDSDWPVPPRYAHISRGYATVLPTVARKTAGFGGNWEI